MSLGSFLGEAGKSGQFMRAERDAMRAERQNQLAIEEQNRREKLRQLQVQAPPVELPKQGIMLGAPMQVTEPAYTPAGQPAVAGITPPEGVPSAPAAAPTGAPAAAPTKGGKVSKLGGVAIPVFNSRDPNKIDAGVAGFQKVDPRASQFDQDWARSANNTLLNSKLGGIAQVVANQNTGLPGYFLKQDEKQRKQQLSAATQWYRSDNAREYFRRNPEMLAVAEKNPLGFYGGLMAYNRRPASGGFWYYETERAKQRQATPAAGAPAGVSPYVANSPYASYIAKAGHAESRGDYQTPNKAGASSAYGKYQFTSGTWIATYRKMFPNTGLDNKRILALRSNPDMQERLMVKLTSDNASALQAAGLPVNDTTLHLAHFLGSAGAVKVLKADQNTPVSAILGADAVKANPSILGNKTAGQVAQWAAATMGGAPVAGAPAPAGGIQYAAAQAPVPTRIDPSNFYLADPNRVSHDMQFALQNRQELARMASMYQQAGMGNEYMATRLKLMEADNSLTFLQGMQGIWELEFANDPRRLAAVWSEYAGVPIQLQPQTDGTFNIVVNGKVTQSGVARSQIVSTARGSFDQQYLQQQAQTSSAMAMEQFKSNLRIGEEQAKQVMDFAKQAQLELIRGDNARANEIVKQMDPNGKITMLPDGSGRSVLQVQGQTFYLDPGGNPIQGAPEGTVSGPSAQPVAGLTARSVGVGAGG